MCLYCSRKKNKSIKRMCSTLCNALLKKYKFMKNFKSQEPMCSANCVRQMIRWRVCAKMQFLQIENVNSMKLG